MTFFSKLGTENNERTFMRLHVSAQIARQRKLLQADIASVWFITCNETEEEEENCKSISRQILPLKPIRWQTATDKNV